VINIDNFYKQVERNLLGAELEKKGDVDKAIELYELNIKEAFGGNHPYDRLVIIFNKRKQYEDRKRVLERGIEVFSTLEKTSPRKDVKPKLERYKKELAKMLLK
jgi:hypothetical protein